MGRYLTPSEERRALKIALRRGRNRWRRQALLTDPHCHYCGAEVSWETSNVDHKKPRAKGGANDPSNYVLSCLKCNDEKGSMPYQQFLLLKKPKPQKPKPQKPKPQAPEAAGVCDEGFYHGETIQTIEFGTGWWSVIYTVNGKRRRLRATFPNKDEAIESAKGAIRSSYRARGKPMPMSIEDAPPTGRVIEGPEPLRGPKVARFAPAEDVFDGT